MYKITILMALMLSGCANFTINGTMCDQIARDPGAIMPQECRDYDEKEADKAFHKIVEEKKVADKDIKFDKEEE
ncbi:hypothetical protein JHD47_00635 [Sulfurimonas sp. SAG-AH-194-L11]|nr:hypothetical protein [Sulfurimonas sp. SAG-AH-194-L11]MDF1876320.1 hypothetical protein [Sulfurimonas sp. SAG-AH-194-L11]